MPGCPLSASTTSPESSPSAGSFEVRAAARALSSAFSTKVSPVSATGGTLNSDWAWTLTCSGSNRWRNSLSLPLLPLARTSCSGATERCFLGGDQFAYTLFCQGHHGVQFVAMEGMTLGRALDLDQAAAV